MSSTTTGRTLNASMRAELVGSTGSSTTIRTLYTSQSDPATASQTKSSSSSALALALAAATATATTTTTTTATTTSTTTKSARSTAKQQPNDSTRSRNHWTSGGGTGDAERSRTFRNKFHHENHYGPFFEEPSNQIDPGKTLVSAVHLFTEAVLNCRVGMLKDKTVSLRSSRERERERGRSGRVARSYIPFLCRSCGCDALRRRSHCSQLAM